MNPYAPHLFIYPLTQSLNDKSHKKLAQLGRLHGPMGTNILAQTAIWIWHPRH